MTSVSSPSSPAANPAATLAEPPTANDRAGLLGGLGLGAVILPVALSVAPTGGTPGDGTDSRTGGPGGDTDAVAGVAPEGTRTVAVQLTVMRVSPAKIGVAAGTRLVLQVTNTDAMRHDLAIEAGPSTAMLAAGQSSRLDMGVVDHAMRGWCTVPGHRAAGMTMSIQVTGGNDAKASGAPTIEFHANPGPDWKPNDPTLRPAWGVTGATEHKVTLRVRETDVEVAPGVRQRMWTYNGSAPGPTLHGWVGDIFTVTLVNEATMGHGIDFHAGSLAPDAPMRTLAPGESLTYQFTARYAGAWLYHCSTMPMSLHLANGMYGAVVIDPPGLAKVDAEVVLVQSELYLGSQGGVVDEAKIAAEHPDAVVFNGYVNQYDHAPIRVQAGDRVRVWVVDAGPQRSTSFHVAGAQFDTVFKEGAYQLRSGNAGHGGAQTLDLAPAQGGFVEFVLGQAGHYSLTDHAFVVAERGAHGVFEAQMAEALTSEPQMSRAH